MRSAAALQYDETKDPAPKIAALGFGRVADRIVELARGHGVPVHQDPHLANLLTQLDIGQYIPPALYHLVAEVLVFIYMLDRKRGSPPPDAPSQGETPPPLEIGNRKSGRSFAGPGGTTPLGDEAYRGQ